MNPLDGVLHQCGRANTAASDWLGTVGVRFASSVVLNPTSATIGAGIHVLTDATMSDFVHIPKGTGKGPTVFRILPDAQTEYRGTVGVVNRVFLENIKRNQRNRRWRMSEKT